MSDLKLFRITDGTASELASSTVALEKSLQTTGEDNMETLFGVRFLASEYSTGRKHAGRIDSLGLDENSSPVIFEYKRATNENVINQGLFYLDWLLDHQAEFQLLVRDRLGAAEGDAIDWRNPRLICVANGYTRYDEYAVQQIDRNIELVRYRDFEGKLLALELIRTTKVEPASAEGAPAPGRRRLPPRTRLLRNTSTRLPRPFATSTSSLRGSARGSAMTSRRRCSSSTSHSVVSRTSPAWRCIPRAETCWSTSR
jgi:hypothetical protein